MTTNEFEQKIQNPEFAAKFARVQRLVDEPYQGPAEGKALWAKFTSLLMTTAWDLEYADQNVRSFQRDMQRGLARLDEAPTDGGYAYDVSHLTQWATQLKEAAQKHDDLLKEFLTLYRLAELAGILN